MIITCASCLTKFNLDDSKIPAKGTKVRCSRCKQVFYVVPSHETKEETFGDFETFGKYHGDQMPGQGEKGGPPPKSGEEERKLEPPSEKEEGFLSPPKTLVEKIEKEPAPLLEEKKAEVKPSKPIRVARAERRGPSIVFALVIILLLIVFGIFYLSTELGSGGRLSSYVEQPIKKITQVWHQLWGTEMAGLTIGDFTRYEESIGGGPFYVIEGRVNNQSGFTKKHVRVKVVIYDREKNRVAEKETICGRVISRSELKNLPSDFFKGDLVLKPQTEGEMTTPAGKSVPFTVIFKDLPADAKEFKVEIVEAPNL
jgi:predicted Zn finger-like uncharacterized protein